MGLSELPPPVEETPGQDLPNMSVRPPGPQSRTWLTRFTRCSAPMGPQFRSESIVKADVPSGSIVLSKSKGVNLLDVDNNRYVDLAAGFGSLLLGHQHPNILRAMELQSERLMQGLGDVYPSDAKIGLLEKLARLHPAPDAQVILAQSGADAVTAAIKTALLATGRSRLIAFRSSYHGLNYASLAVSDLRSGYKDPFRKHLPQDTTFLDYPATEEGLTNCQARLQVELAKGDVAALVFEPILGRGGVIVPPKDFVQVLRKETKKTGTLLIADEVWTGLGRSGEWLYSCKGSASAEDAPDLVCIGKGLGGGLPISACIGTHQVMAAWEQEDEVVHTSTFSGAPLACTTALATLDVLSRHSLLERSARVGAAFLERLREKLAGTVVREVRGAGLMVGLDLSQSRGGAGELMARLLRHGYVTSTGGGARDVLVLTPPLIISEELLLSFEDTLQLSILQMS
ncbi:MAG: aspartate aminotransferase family protein [Polyangiaceae bacterium]|nr:aspartate aminotransferase family protein [Polyangiaceae bacterium]